MVYVDDMNAPATVGRLHSIWCHMYADTDAELHAMARRIGLRRSWFQYSQHLPHYDVTAQKRVQALKAGAIPTKWPSGVKSMILKRRGAENG